MNPTKYAVFTFFKLYGCGHCVTFKGKEGDPNSPWEQITSDQDLKDAGVEFILFEVGTVVDEKTGRQIRHDLPDAYKGKIRGYPYLELRLPNSMDEGIHYTQSRQPDKVKAWILETLETPQFQEYRQSVENGRSPPQSRATVTQMSSEPSRVPQPIPTPQVRQHQQEVRVQERQERQAVQQKKQNKFLPANI